MEISQKLLDELCREIDKRNRELNPQAVVHSDAFIKYISSSTGITKDSVKFAVKVLIDAHKIFAIELTAEDEKRKVDQVEGYVVADLPVVRNLKSFFDDQLVRAYEHQFHKRQGAAQIKKELFSMIKNLNNTELGQILNKAIMLNEYERLLEKDWEQYSPEFQEQRLAEFALKNGFKYVPKVPVKISLEMPAEPESEEKADSEPRRAIDTPEFKDYSDKESQYPLARILNIYGIDFFLKVQFRQYKFDYVRQAVEARQINKKAELNAIREMLSKVKDGMYSGRDPRLSEHKEQIFSLERAVTHAIYFSV